MKLGLIFSLLAVVAGAPQFPLGGSITGNQLSLGTPALPDSFLANLSPVNFVPIVGASAQSSVVEAAPAIVKEGATVSIAEPSEQNTVPEIAKIPEVSEATNEPLPDPIDASKVVESVPVVANDIKTLPALVSEPVKDIPVPEVPEEKAETPTIAVEKDADEPKLVMEEPKIEIISEQIPTAEVKQEAIIEKEEENIDLETSATETPIIDEIETVVTATEKTGRSIPIENTENKLIDDMKTLAEIKSTDDVAIDIMTEFDKIIADTVSATDSESKTVAEISTNEKKNSDQTSPVEGNIEETTDATITEELVTDSPVESMDNLLAEIAQKELLIKVGREDSPQESDSLMVDMNLLADVSVAKEEKLSDPTESPKAVADPEPATTIIPISLEDKIEEVIDSEPASIPEIPIKVKSEEISPKAKADENDKSEGKAKSIGKSFDSLSESNIIVKSIADLPELLISEASAIKETAIDTVSNTINGDTTEQEKKDLKVEAVKPLEKKAISLDKDTIDETLIGTDEIKHDEKQDIAKVEAAVINSIPAAQVEVQEELTSILKEDSAIETVVTTESIIQEDIIPTTESAPVELRIDDTVADIVETSDSILITPETKDSEVQVAIEKDVAGAEIELSTDIPLLIEDNEDPLTTEVKIESKTVNIEATDALPLKKDEAEPSTAKENIPKALLGNIDSVLEVEQKHNSDIVPNDTKEKVDITLVSIVDEIKEKEIPANEIELKQTNEELLVIDELEKEILSTEKEIAASLTDKVEIQEQLVIADKEVEKEVQTVIAIEKEAEAPIALEQAIQEKTVIEKEVIELPVVVEQSSDSILEPEVVDAVILKSEIPQISISEPEIPEIPIIKPELKTLPSSEHEAAKSTISEPEIQEVSVIVEEIPEVITPKEEIQEISIPEVEIKEQVLSVSPILDVEIVEPSAPKSELPEVSVSEIEIEEIPISKPKSEEPLTSEAIVIQPSISDSEVKELSVIVKEVPQEIIQETSAPEIKIQEEIVPINTVQETLILTPDETSIVAEENAAIVSDHSVFVADVKEPVDILTEVVAEEIIGKEDSISLEPTIVELPAEKVTLDIAPVEVIQQKIAKPIEAVIETNDLKSPEIATVVQTETKPIISIAPEVPISTIDKKVQLDGLAQKTEESFQSNSINSIQLAGKSISSSPEQQHLSQNKISIANTPIVRSFGFGTLNANSGVSPSPVLYNGAFVDPRSLVAPRFRQYIYSNDASDIVAAKVALFRLHAAIQPHRPTAKKF